MSAHIPSVDTSIARITNAASKRASSWDRSGRNTDCIMIEPGETAVLAEARGAGCIRHLYFTMIHPSLLDYRDAVLRMYWDGEKEPSVEVPLGDFFCISACTIRRFSSYFVAVNLGCDEPHVNNGLNAYFPMPFAHGARIELTNESDRHLGGLFGRLWYHIDYESWPAPPDRELGRFHAQWRRRNPTPVTDRSERFGTNIGGEENYRILEACGAGHVVGLFLQVDNIQGGWYGEGDDMIFIDGDTWPPSIHGTGTEEIFGGGAGPNAEYASLYSGFLLVENAGGTQYAGKNAMYRWYVHDQLRFQESIRMTIEHGHANDFRNDYTSVAYWYQREPHGPFPELPGLRDRRPRMPDGFDTAEASYGELAQRFVPRWQAIFGEDEIPAELHGALRLAVQGDRALHQGNPREAEVYYTAAGRALGA